MKHRSLEGRSVSEVGLGTWQLGGTDWGTVTEEDALDTLEAAAAAGINFMDTADIYGMGRSETLIGKFLSSRPDRDRFIVATKLGRHPEPGWPDNFTEKAMRRHTEASLDRLGVSSLDLTQTHCVPGEEMQNGRVFENLRRLQNDKLIRAFGASVESCDEAIRCLRVPGLTSLQVIFNVFRQKPLETLFAQAQEAGVALIVRLPLASGLLSDRFSGDSTFPSSDHRNYNRDGEFFNVGETFSGLTLEKGVELVAVLRDLVPDSMPMTQFALRWCLDHDAVTTVIPGTFQANHVRENAQVSDLPVLNPSLHGKLSDFYHQEVASHIRGNY